MILVSVCSLGPSFDRRVPFVLESFILVISDFGFEGECRSSWS